VARTQTQKVRSHKRTVNGRTVTVQTHQRTGLQPDRAIRNLDRAYRRNRRKERLPAAILATVGVGELTLWSVVGTTTFIVHVLSVAAGLCAALGIWWWRTRKNRGSE
jgi:hypothetical protein